MEYIEEVQKQLEVVVVVKEEKIKAGRRCSGTLKCSAFILASRTAASTSCLPVTLRLGCGSSMPRIGCSRATSGLRVLCDTFNAKERFKVLDDNKEMIKLVGGSLCVNAVVEMRVVMDETSHHQNTHWRESIQMQRVQLFRNHIIRHMLTHSGEKLHECT